jgi:hypothetical protein
MTASRRASVHVVGTLHRSAIRLSSVTAPSDGVVAMKVRPASGDTCQRARRHSRPEPARDSSSPAPAGRRGTRASTSRRYTGTRRTGRSPPGRLCSARHSGLVLLNEIAHARIAPVCDDSLKSRRIRRSIVDDDDLEVVERLRQYRVHRAREELGGVPGRNDDADVWHRPERRARRTPE